MRAARKFKFQYQLFICFFPKLQCTEGGELLTVHNTENCQCFLKVSVDQCIEFIIDFPWISLLILKCSYNSKEGKIK